MSKRRWAYISAVLNLVGAVFLYYSFQASSTPFILKTDAHGKAALCIGQVAMFVVDHPGAVGISPGSGCPDWPTSVPTAVVNSEHPLLGKIGFFLILLGFLTQLPSIEGSLLTAEDVRLLRKARKILDS
jgi:hypothetical protein